MVEIRCSCQFLNFLGTSKLGPRGSESDRKDIIRRKSGSWPTTRVGSSPVPESWESVRWVILMPYARLANESRSCGVGHDIYGRDGACRLGPALSSRSPVVFRRTVQRGGMGVGQAARPRVTPDQVQMRSVRVPSSGWTVSSVVCVDGSGLVLTLPHCCPLAPSMPR